MVLVYVTLNQRDLSNLNLNQQSVVPFGPRNRHRCPLARCQVPPVQQCAKFLTTPAVLWH